MKNINQGHCAVFVTTATYNRNKLFHDRKYAQIVVDALHFGNENRWYQLIGYVVMPDHLHVIIIPQNKKLPDIMKSLKGFTAREINIYRNSNNNVWQQNYYVVALDKIEFFHQKLKYIEDNPVRTGLVENSMDYPFSSADNYEELELSNLY